MKLKVAPSFAIVLASLLGVQAAAAPVGAPWFEPRPRQESTDEPTASTRLIALPNTHRGTAGAATCKACHPDVFAEWDASPHGRTSRPVASPTGGSDLAIGSSWMQAHLRRDASGLHRILPECYDIEAEAWRDVDEMMDAIQGPLMPEDNGVRPQRRTNRRTFERDCAGCHVSGTQLREDVESRRIIGGWRDTSIDCEACHGPALAHVEAWESLDDNKPMLDLKRLDARTSTGVCARCHGGSPVGSAFTALDAEHWIAPPQTSGGVYSHGAAGGQIYQADAFFRSECYLAGGLTCTDCHAWHGNGLRHTEHRDALCTRCHEAESTPAHTHHSVRGEGGECIACHMPTLLTGLLKHQRDHRIASPLPAAPEAPDACTSCHTDKDKAWAAEWSETWWGPPNADTLAAVRGIHLARSGKLAEATPLLKTASAHPDPFFRWAAASWLRDPAGLVDETLPEGRLLALTLAAQRPDGGAILQTALDDPAPYLRALAYTSLLQRGPVRGEAPLEDLEIASRVARDAYELRVVLARTYVAENRVPEAIDLLEETVVYGRRQPNAWLVLAGAYALEQRDPEAAASVKRWSAMVEPLVHLDRFLPSLARSGEAKLAQAVLDAVAKHLPDRELRSAVEQRRRQYQKALKRGGR